MIFGDMKLQSRLHWFPNSLLKASYIYAHSTLFISLSHAGRILAMPGSDCPVLSCRQEGMIIVCAFLGRWLNIYSENILEQGIAKHQIGCQTLNFEFFLPLWAQIHYSSNCHMQAACLQCQRQLTHPVLIWRQGEKKYESHCFSRCLFKNDILEYEIAIK